MDMTQQDRMPERNETVTCIKDVGAVHIGNSAEVSTVTDNEVVLYGKGCGRYEHIPRNAFWEHFRPVVERTLSKEDM